MTRPSEAPPAESAFARRARRWRSHLSKWGGYVRNWRGPPRKWRVPITAALLLLTMLAIAWQRSAPSAPSASSREAPDAGANKSVATLHGPHAVEGTVEDDQGEPLAGALLRVSALGAPELAPREARSDAQGAFRVDDLPGELLSVEAIRDGHESKEHTFRAGETARITFVLARQGELAVALRDLPGQPVDGAEILLTGPGLWPAQTGRASAGGEHVFKGLPAGEYQVRARRGERVGMPSRAVSVVPGARTKAELVMLEGARLAGVVFDRHTGALLAEAEVAIQDLTPGIDAQRVVTDGRGEFELRGLWPGAVRIEVQRDGYAATSRNLRLPHEGALELRLAGAAALAGLVLDEQGEPIEGARLSVASDEGLPIELAAEAKREGQGELGVTTGPVPEIPVFESTDFALGTLAAESDARGRFRIDRLAPEPLVLHVARAGFVPERVPVNDLKPHAETRDLRVVLRAAGRVVGRIVDVRQRPLSGVYVAARSAEGERSAMTNDRGEYVLRDLLGNVSVEAQPDGHTVLRCHVRVAAGAEERCDLTAETAVHELWVRVVDEYGMGLEGALVTLTARAGSASPHTAAQLTRRDGRVLLRELPAPPYALDISLTGYLTRDDLPVPDADADRELKVQLGRAATLAGFVVDALGRAVPGAIVGTEEGEASGETDPEGTFKLEGVAPGAQALLAHHPRAGEGRSAVVRARPSEQLDGVRIVLAGRLSEEELAAQEAPETRRDAKAVREARAPKGDYVIEQRGRALVVTEVADNGAAASAGLRAGDVLAAVDGEPPLSIAHARGLLRDPPGRTAVLRVLRNTRPVHLHYRRPSL